MEIEHFKYKNWIAMEGSPGRSGVFWVEEEKSYNFTLFSREATAVTLLIFDDADYVNPVFNIPLTI
jgi:isoamylase